MRVRVDDRSRAWNHACTGLNTGRPRKVLPTPTGVWAHDRLDLSCTVRWSLSTRPQGALHTVRLSMPASFSAHRDPYRRPDLTSPSTHRSRGSRCFASTWARAVPVTAARRTFVAHLLQVRRQRIDAANRGAIPRVRNRLGASILRLHSWRWSTRSCGSTRTTGSSTSHTSPPTWGQKCWPRRSIGAWRPGSVGEGAETSSGTRRVSDRLGAAARRASFSSRSAGSDPRVAQ